MILLKYKCYSYKNVFHQQYCFLRFGFFLTKARAMVNGAVVSYVMVKQDMYLVVT